MDKIIFFLVLFSGFFYIYHFWNTEKPNYLLQYIFVVLFCSFFGFRSDVSGSDTGTYLRYFQSLIDLNMSHNFEPGFESFSQVLVSFVSKDVYLILILLIQITAFYMAIFMLRLRNSLACIWLFLAFMPGLDLISSAMRSFLAASVGIFFLVSVTNRPLLRWINFLPVYFHFSYLLVPMLSIIPNRIFSVRKLNFIYAISIILFVFFAFFDLRFLESLLYSYTSGYGVLSKLVRYVLLENDLLSPLVRFYFAFVSIVLSSVIMYVYNLMEHERVDRRFKNLVTIAILSQFFYALVSFTDFAYRFYYIYYCIQIVAAVFALSSLTNKKLALTIYFGLLVLGVTTTYGTNKFSHYSFFGTLF